MPPKTPIWKSIGRNTNRTNLLPWVENTQKKGKNRGKRESERVKRIGHEREEKGMGRKRVFIVERGDDQRSFKLRSCGAKILTGNNRFQNGPPHGGRIIDRLCAFLSLSSFPSSSPLTFTPLRSCSLYPHPLSVIPIFSLLSIVRLSSRSCIFFCFPFLPSLNFY